MQNAGWTNKAAERTLLRVPYQFRVVEDFSSLDESQWNGLNHLGNPFLSHAFLSRLETTGSVAAQNGWQPHHLALFSKDRLLAFLPAYLKSHSRGEFVFDWSWADAYHRHGRAYYPKLLSGIPWSPISGPRLLTAKGVDEAALKAQLIRHALEECSAHSLSSWHCNFVLPSDEEALAEAGLLPRHDWQFHWHNAAYESFDSFLATLKSRKRKAIRKERQRVADLGIDFCWKNGAELDEGDLDYIYRCYTRTFAAYGNHPALTPDFFAKLAADLPGAVQVVFALKGDEKLAMGYFLAGGGRLYGRYWGCSQEVPGLHFETAYYQGIEYCIRNGVEVFESGAQGEHKISRGFVPVPTRSYHYLAAPDFRRAIADYLEKERTWMSEYRQQLASHEPYRADLP